MQLSLRASRLWWYSRGINRTIRVYRLSREGHRVRSSFEFRRLWRSTLRVHSTYRLGQRSFSGARIPENLIRLSRIRVQSWSILNGSSFPFTRVAACNQIFLCRITWIRWRRLRNWRIRSANLRVYMSFSSDCWLTVIICKWAVCVWMAEIWLQITSSTKVNLGELIEQFFLITNICMLQNETIQTQISVCCVWWQKLNSHTSLSLDKELPKYSLLLYWEAWVLVIAWADSTSLPSSSGVNLNSVSQNETVFYEQSRQL